MSIHRELTATYEMGLELARARAAAFELPVALASYAESPDVPPAASRGRRLTWRGLLEKLDDRSIALVGDYHSDAEVREVGYALAACLVASGRSLVVALEAAALAQQPLLDAYLRGDCPEAELLARLEVDRPGFGWSALRGLLRLGRDAGVPLCALDSGRGTPLQRDRFMARRLRGSLRDHPSALHLAFVGELHLRPQHLPARLARSPQALVPLVVTVNDTASFAAHLRAGGLPPPIVAGGRDRVALFTASPVEKLLSPAEDALAGRPQPFMDDLELPLADWVGVFSRVLDLPPPPLEQLHVFDGDWEAFARFREARGAAPAGASRSELQSTGARVSHRPWSVYVTAPTCDRAAAAALMLLSKAWEDPGPAGRWYRCALAELGRQLALPRPRCRALSRRWRERGRSWLADPPAGTDPWVEAGEEAGHRLFWSMASGATSRDELRAFLTEGHLPTALGSSNKASSGDSSPRTGNLF